MKILLFNQCWFPEELREGGHEVITCGFDSRFDVVLQHPLIRLTEILKVLPKSFNPEVIVVFDNSLPLLILGIEDSPIPTVFYSVDVHHHYGLHKFIAHIFDRTLVAQRDYLPHFQEVNREAFWFPLWAPKLVEPKPDKKYGAVFVGTMDRHLNPERVRFFDELKKVVPVEVMTTHYESIFPASEIVINQTVKGDVNFRIFESMMCGAMLLTEKSPNGLSEIFEDGKHLVLYQKNNIQDAAEKISYYLANPSERKRIAEAGRDEVLKNHSGGPRSEQLVEHLKEVRKNQSPQRNFSAMINLVTLSVMYEERESAIVAQALAEAIRSLERALDQNEPISDFFANYTVLTTFLYDRLVVSKHGRDFILRASENYPDVQILRYAKARHLLNMGRKSDAISFLQSFLPGATEKVLPLVDRAVTELIQSILSAVRGEKSLTAAL